MFPEQTPHPFQSLLRLILMVIGFGILSQIIAILIIASYYTYTRQVFSLESLMNGSANEMRFMLLMSSLGSFVVPSYLMNTREGYGITYFKLKKWPSGMQFGYIFLAMLSFMPLMSLIGHWNESLQLPDNMQSLQRWMERSEKESGDLIKGIIMDSSISGFLYNIVVLALIPAIGEELLFRGILQKIIGRWLSNQHVVIWLVAIIFSAIHLQFFGFVPRMLLGAFFGYLYVWSKNIILSIFGHFVNNAGATIGAFYYMRQGKSYDELNAFELQSWWIYLVAFIFTLIFVFLFYRSTQKENNGERLEKN
ncbi:MULTISPECIES: CPBP family intramembrane glutamic endopeptidase [Sphingobacterium]|uniref:CAAX amino terminal protease self- immunity n=1 Tax=Sphingobacterium multivorum TaxID=28454 RepID=A0A2X2LFF8_SPHMU|nr:CPBP family intramembrane glutamic endopeptidase [Sphingobacterium multivorum]QRQ60993.1 CPBP family intramembrane metalloprotease [Sphingobacterium multivorum]SPZ88040.1 CAAX amino terminal protease self- immunity [Sphingobacterium multivorum]